MIRPGIFVDIFGVETFVPLAELSYQRMMDATTAFQPGQRVLVRILRIQGQRPSEITVEAGIYLDCTGNGDAAYLAGCSYESGQPGTGVPRSLRKEG